MVEEIFIVIPGYKNYCVSNKGKILSLWKRKSNFIFLKQMSMKNGYKKVTLCAGNKNRYNNPLVHRLVWEAFNGKIPEKLQVNHIDGDKSNNALDNLELCTVTENMRHRWKNDLSPRVLNTTMVKDIRNLFHSQRMSITSIAKLLSVKRQTVYQVTSGKTWKHI